MVRNYWRGTLVVLWCALLWTGAALAGEFTVNPTRLDLGAAARSSAVTVRNEGKVAGDEIAQLYLSFPSAPGMPIRALRGFSRVHLAPGESRRIHFDLGARDLSSVTADGRRVVAPGDYRLVVGGGQPGSGAAASETRFSIKGAYSLPL